MPNHMIILNGAITTDTWTVVAKEATSLPTGKNLILPFQLWQMEKINLTSRLDIAVWLDSDELPTNDMAEQLKKLPLIAVNFPMFTDGRGFSIARLLRDRIKFQGDLRAIGYVLRDQLCFMKRCGFNSFSLPESSNLEEALDSLDDFTEYYQAATDQPLPIFRRN